MDGRDHNWFTEAREQETNLRCTGQLRLTDWCPKWVRALGAHLLPERCTLCDTVLRRMQETALWAQVRREQKGVRDPLPAGGSLGVHQCPHLEVCSEVANGFRLGL